MENEITKNEELELVEVNDDETESSGMGTGLAMLIGSGLTLAVIAGGKKLKKVWDNHKDKKEREKEGVVADAEYEEVDDEDEDDGEEESK